MLTMANRALADQIIAVLTTAPGMTTGQVADSVGDVLVAYTPETYAENGRVVQSEFILTRSAINDDVIPILVQLAQRGFVAGRVDASRRCVRWELA